MKWSEDWKVFLNLYLWITNKRTTTDFTYFMKQHQIHQSRNATYLGVTIDEHLKWSDHIERIVCKANSVNALLR